MNITTLGEVAQISMGSAPPGKSYNEVGNGIPMIAGAGDYGEKYPKPKKWTTSPSRITEIGDLIVCVRATIGDLNWADKKYCLGRGVAGLRAKKGKLDINFAAHYINAKKIDLTKLGTGSTFLAIRRADLENFPIPLPPLAEQKRIAAILDKADAIRRKRRQAIKLTDEFLRAVFLDMFGDPMTNPKGYNSASLGDLVKIISGGTPSKAEKRFWNGMFPWVSPKDMKSITISNSIDKISKIVFSETPLKRIPQKSILIVIRGMILAHTIPIAITEKEVAINQDIKALIPKQPIVPQFLLWSLIVMHNLLLSKVSTAAHGTKRIDMESLKNTAILLPTIVQQNQFVEIVNKFSSVKSGQALSLEQNNALFNSLSQRAFQGEL
jgi:type I restriction enzyme S subunit